MRAKIVYLTITRQRLTLHDFKADQQVNLLAALHWPIAKKASLIVGEQANKHALDYVEPFNHARCIIEPFAAAERIVKHLFELAHCRHCKVIVHVTEPLAGGLTEIECKALIEMALGAGASQAVMHTGTQPLSDLAQCQAILKQASSNAVQTPLWQWAFIGLVMLAAIVLTLNSAG